MSITKDESNIRSEIVKYDTKDVEKRLKQTRKNWETLSQNLQTIKDAIRLQELIEEGNINLKKDQKKWKRGFWIIAIALPAILIPMLDGIVWYHGLEGPIVPFLAGTDAFILAFIEMVFLLSFHFYPKRPEKSELQDSLEELLSEELKTMDIELLKEKQLELEDQIETVRKKCDKCKEIINDCKTYNWLKILECVLGNSQNIEAMIRNVKQKIDQLENTGEISTKEQDLREIVLYGLSQDWNDYIHEPISSKNIPDINHLKYMPSTDPITFTNQPKSLALVLNELENQNQDLK